MGACAGKSRFASCSSEGIALVLANPNRHHTARLLTRSTVASFREMDSVALLKYHDRCFGRLRSLQNSVG